MDRAFSPLAFFLPANLGRCPRAALGICSWIVERRIKLEERILPSCHYHLPTLHANSVPKSLIEAVRARRIALKMTLREFSKTIGRTIWTISEWENRRAVPKRSSRERLIQWLGFNPEAVDTKSDK
jgi:DNA-binding transcriptional regulator YiaG